MNISYWIKFGGMMMGVNKGVQMSAWSEDQDHLGRNHRVWSLSKTDADLTMEEGVRWATEPRQEDKSLVPRNCATV